MIFEYRELNQNTNHQLSESIQHITVHEYKDENRGYNCFNFDEQFYVSTTPIFTSVPILRDDDYYYEKFPIEMHEQGKNYAIISFVPFTKKNLDGVSEKVNLSETPQVVSKGLSYLYKLIGEYQHLNIDYLIAKTNPEMATAATMLGFQINTKYHDIISITFVDLIANKPIIKEMYLKAFLTMSWQNKNKYKILTRPIHL